MSLTRCRFSCRAPAEFQGGRKFADLVSGLLSQYDGVQALSWVPRVTSAARADFEARAREDGLSGFRIAELTPDGKRIDAAERDEYFPVRVQKHFRGDDSILGLDLSSEPERRQAIMRATDTGKAAVTARVPLLSAGRDRGWGVLIFSPIYAEGAHTGTVEARRAGLVGLAVGVFRVSDMLETILDHTTVPVGLDQYFFDGPAPDAARLIHTHQSRVRIAEQAPPVYDDVAGRHGIRKLLTVADRQWAVVTVPAPGKFSHAPPLEAWGLLLLGAVATAFGTLYVFTILYRAQRLADAARIVEDSPTILFRFAAEHGVPLVYISDNVKRLGYPAEDLLASPHRWLQALHPDDRANMMAGVRDIVEGRGDHIRQEFRWIKPDGSPVWIDSRLSAVRDKAHRLVALEGTGIDISERKAAEAKIVEVARTDVLTALPNRLAFIEQLGIAFATAKRGGAPFAVLSLDLDSFKDLNNTLGHPMGDKLLQLVAERLGHDVRPSDLVARFGGDEFAVLQRGAADPAEAGLLADRIRKDLKSPFELEGNIIRITVSIGICMFDAALADSADMLTHADLALYRAKEAGRDRFAFHSDDLDRIVRERVSITEDLHTALEKGGELEVYYQPQVEMVSGRIVGVEALVRWNHPKRGQIMPSDFIPIAEKTGVITALGAWVLNESCRQMSCWRSEGIAPPVMAVNISAVQLMTNLAFDKEIAGILAKWGLRPGDLELELTESVLMETTQERRGFLGRIWQSGVRIAIDDFGTGYSSFNYLRNYQINRLKIAQQFIFGLPGNTDDIAITRATLSLAGEFKIEVIAEGVETAEQAALLLSLGCKYAQGYYFSRPMPADRIALLLRRGRVDVAASPVH